MGRVLFNVETLEDQLEDESKSGDLASTSMALSVRLLGLKCPEFLTEDLNDRLALSKLSNR